MKTSSVMTVRIPTDLLEALKRKAQREGRTTSGEVVHLVRENVEARSSSPRKRIKAWGMFAHLGEPADLEEIIAGRREISGELLRAVHRKARRA